MNGRRLQNLGIGVSFQEEYISNYDEMEDRLLLASNKAISPINRYCDSIHYLIHEGLGRRNHKWVSRHVDSLKESAAARNIPFYYHRSLPLTQATVVDGLHQPS